MDFLYQFIDAQVVFALSWAILPSLWQGLLILFLVKIGFRTNLAWRADTRYRLAFGGLLAILMAFAGTFGWYYEPLAIHTTVIIEPTTPSAAAFAEWIPTPLSWWQRVELNVSAYQHITASLWLLGFCFFMLRMIGGLWYVQRIKEKNSLPLPSVVQDLARQVAAKLGMRRLPSVMASTRINSPAVIGWIKPVVLFPVALVNQLSTEELEAVLAHELAHIIRQDYLLNILQTLAEAMLYFNPAVWLLSTIIRREREHSCDDMALQVCAHPIAYAKTLLKLEEMMHPVPAMAMGLHSEKGRLLLRIKRILQPEIKSNSMEKTLITGLFMAFVFTVSLQATERADTGFTAPLALGTQQDSVPKTIIKRVIKHTDGRNVETETENGRLTSLIIDGREIPPAEWSSYPEFVPKATGPEEKVSVFMVKDVEWEPGEKTLSRDKGNDGKAAYFADTIHLVDWSNTADKGSGETNVTINVSDDGRVTVLSRGVQGRVREADNNGVETRILEFNVQDMDKVQREKYISKILFDSMGIPSTSSTNHIKTIDVGEDGRVTVRFDGAFYKNDVKTRILEFNANDMENIQREKIIQILDDSMGIPPTPPTPPGNNIHVFEAIEFPNHGLNSSNAQRALEKEMLRDGLVAKGAAYKLELGNSYMKVNGKKMPEGLSRKYQQIYESQTGIPIVKGSRILLNK